MYYMHVNHPPGSIRVFLCPRRRNPYLQVIYLRTQWSPGLTWTNVPHVPFYFLLGQDPVFHVNRIYQYRYGFPRKGYLLVEVYIVLCYLLESDSQWGGDAVSGILIQNIHPRPHFSWKGGSRWTGGPQFPHPRLLLVVPNWYSGCP